MNAQDILTVFLIAALFIITACIVYISFYFAGALKSITQLSDDLDEAAQSLKNKIQMKVFAAIPALLVALAGKIIKRKRG